MSVVDPRAMDEASEPRRPVTPMGRGQVIAIVAIGYLAAAGAVAATLLLPVG